MSGNIQTHIPVLFEEVMNLFAGFGDKPCRMIDGTLGRGGHAAGLLSRHPKMELLGIDRDEEAIRQSAEVLDFAAARVTLINGNYSELESIARSIGWESADGVLLDIGVSSPQLDEPERGFSWRQEGPLDMRMDRSAELTASRILNKWGEKEIADLLYQYGEVRKSRKLASEIIRRREEKPFETTTDLVEACDRVLGRAGKGELPHPTLVFQALRIAVNDELGELDKGLESALEILGTGGVMAIISFHSLEDRMVKNFIRDRAKNCVCPPNFPVCICNHRAELKEIGRKALAAGENELAQNRRAASARLRAAQKII